MTKSIVQFHADPEELLRFVSEAAKELDLYVSVFWKGQGFRKVPKGSDLLAVVAAHELPSEAFLTRSEPMISDHMATQDFLRANPGALSVSIGNLVQDGLDESAIGFVTKDSVLAMEWRRIINRLKRRTRSGAKTKSIVTGLSGINKSHRYTAAAQELAQKGVTMWALGRKTVFEFSPRHDISRVDRPSAARRA